MVVYQITYDLRSYMVTTYGVETNHVKNHIPPKSCVESHMVPHMINNVISYACLSNHIYVPHVELIYDLLYMKSYVKSYMNMWIKSYVKSYECRTYQNIVY